MAEAAQELLAGSGWLPNPLRTPGQALVAAADDGEPLSVTDAEDHVAAHAMAAE